LCFVAFGFALTTQSGAILFGRRLLSHRILLWPYSRFKVRTLLQTAWWTIGFHLATRRLNRLLNLFKINHHQLPAYTQLLDLSVVSWPAVMQPKIWYRDDLRRVCTVGLALPFSFIWSIAVNHYILIWFKLIPHLVDWRWISASILLGFIHCLRLEQLWLLPATPPMLILYY